MSLPCLKDHSVDSMREEFVATWSQADEVLYKPFGITRLLDRVGELCPAPGGVA